MKFIAPDRSRAAVIIHGVTFRPDAKGVFDLVQPYASAAAGAGLIEEPTEQKAAPEPEDPPAPAPSNLED